MTPRRTWSVAQFKSLKSQPGDPQAGDSQAVDSSDASRPAPPSKPLGRKFFGKFTVYLIFFSVLGLFWSSKFPVALGAFLFVTDDEFIA
jgi:hypothetical protein